MTTWNTASLFGTLLTSGRRQTAKRKMLDDILLQGDVIPLQETRGTEADMTTLPPTHDYVGTFLSSSSAGSSSAGGAVLGLRIALTQSATSSTTAVHMRGRALTRSIFIGQWLRFTAVHVDSSLTLRRRKQLLDDIAAYLADNGGISFLLGDRNFLHSDETRLLSSGEEVRPNTALASHFGELFKDFIELRQQEPTFRRLARASGDNVFQPH